MSVKVWFEAKTIEDAIKMGMRIWKFEEFGDCCVMVESPKKSIAVVGSEKKVTKKDIQEIEKRKWTPAISEGTATTGENPDWATVSN